MGLGWGDGWVCVRVCVEVRWTRDWGYMMWEWGLAGERVVCVCVEVRRTRDCDYIMWEWAWMGRGLCVCVCMGVCVWM